MFLLRCIVADDTGLIKGDHSPAPHFRREFADLLRFSVVTVEKPAVVLRFGSQSKENRISSLCWGPRADVEDESCIVAGHKSGVVRLWGLPAAGCTTAPEAPVHEVDTEAGAVVAVKALPLDSDHG